MKSPVDYVGPERRREPIQTHHWDPDKAGRFTERDWGKNVDATCVGCGAKAAFTWNAWQITRKLQIGHRQALCPTHERRGYKPGQARRWA